MENLQLNQVPIARVGMLIPRPAAEVFEVADSTSGFSPVLAGLKALLEHGVRLNLVADRFPEGIAGH